MIKEVGIDEIASNKYSLDYTKYGIKKEETKEVEGIDWKELGEVCEFKNGKNITKDKFIDGEYFVVGGGLKPFGKHNQYNVNENTIVISKDGAYAGYVSKYNTKIFVSNHGIYIDNFRQNILKDYLYYYLKISLQDTLFKLQSGAAQPGVNKENIAKIVIPIPSLEKQNKIVEVLDNLFTDKYNLQSVAEYYENNDIFKLLLDEKYYIFQKLVEWQDQSNEFTKQIEFVKNKQTNYLFLVGMSETVVKTLGEVCNFKNGKGIKKDTLVEGEYPVIGGGQKPMGFHNEYNTDENTILCSSSGAYAGFISKYNKKVWASDCFSIIPKATLINNTYLYYLLKTTQDTLYKHQSGAAQPHVYSKDLQSLKIPIPSLEKQKEIVAYCDANNNLIKQLENEIEHNKNLAQQFIKGIVKNVLDIEVEEEAF